MPGLLCVCVQYLCVTATIFLKVNDQTKRQRQIIFFFLNLFDIRFVCFMTQRIDLPAAVVVVAQRKSVHNYSAWVLPRSKSVPLFINVWWDACWLVKNKP